MNRRHFLSAALVAISLDTLGQTPPGQERFKPYLQVKQVPGDENLVRVFFSPACPYSRQYFQFFRNLARTLPANKVFRFTPLVNKGDGIGYALAFLAVQKFYPVYVENFVEASLIGVQDRGLTTTSWAGIDRISVAAHVPVSVPLLVSKNRDTLKTELDALLRLQKQLEVTNTPAVAVAGTYVVTPEFTMGDPALFSQLVNAVISMTYQPA